MMVNIELLERLVSELKKTLPEKKEKMSNDEILQLSKCIGILMGISGEAMGLIQDISVLGKTRIDSTQQNNIKIDKNAN